MERPRARSARAYLRSRLIVAPAAPGHRHVSSTARSKRACSGCLTKIIRRLAASKLILTCASAVRSAPAKVPTGRFSTAVRGMRSRWCQPMIGKECTELHFRMRHLHLQRSFNHTLHRFLTDCFCGEGCLFLHSGRSIGGLCVGVDQRQIIFCADEREAAQGFPNALLV